MFSKPPFGAPPGDDFKIENPDGVFSFNGLDTTHNLYDTGGQRPAIPSGDWQVRQVPIYPQTREPK